MRTGKYKYQYCETSIQIPVNEFENKYKSVNLFNSPNSEGIGPTNLTIHQYINIVTIFMVPTLGLIAAKIIDWYNNKHMHEQVVENLPNSLIPSNLLPYKCNDDRILNLPNSDGMVPYK